MSDALLVIEPQRDYDAVVRQYLVGVDKLPRIFLPNFPHEKRLIEAATQHGIDLRRVIIPFGTIDANTDTYMYSVAGELADALIRIVRRRGRAFFADAAELVPRAAAPALTVAMLDRFAGQLRVLVRLRTVVEAGNFSRVSVVARPNRPRRQVRPLFAVMGFRRVEFVTEHLQPRQRVSLLDAEDADPFAIPQKLQVLPEYDYAEIRRHVEDGASILFFANLRDHQYRLTATAVVEALQKAKTPMIVMSNHLVHPAQLEGFTIASSTAIAGKQPTPPPIDLRSDEGAQLRDALSDIVRRFHKHMTRHEDPFVRACAWTLLDYVRMHLGALLRFAASFCRNMQRVVDQLHCVVASPSRYPEAQILVRMARLQQIPTTEIQTGTISPTPRFIRPVAKDVLCIDPFSFDVYTKFLGHPPQRTFVVGGPKIDLDLKPFRKLSRVDARRALHDQLSLPEWPIVTLTSQPIGVESMIRVVGIVAGGIGDADEVILLIKQHHNEDERYAAAYELVAERFGVRSMVVSKTANLHHSLLAADLVATYYSTTGIEAFCLDRPVACLNPFRTRPPFDLVALGLATEIKTAAEFREYVKQGMRSRGEADKRLDMLKDGRASERCAKHLMLQVRSHRRSVQDTSTLQISN